MSKKRSTAKKPAATAPAASSKVARRGLGCSIATVLLLIGMLAGAAVGTPWLLQFLANGATDNNTLTAGAAHDLLVEQQQAATTQLESYGWVDKTAGVARVPIARAMELLAASTLPVGAAAAVPQQEAATSTGSDSGVPADVNFTDDILPIFQDRCSECHSGDDPEQGLLLTSYKGVMLGSIYGAVVKPGDPEGSYLVEMVSTGQMPKKGPDLTPEQINTIIAWIAAGAPEFGSGTGSSTAIRNTVTASGTLTTTGTVTATAITPENVSFAADVLPIFQDRCFECHSGDDPEEGLALTSYKDVMAGSIYGAVIKPNDVDGSYLVEMITTGQMPKKGPDLTKAQIDTILAWIEAGAPDN